MVCIIYQKFEVGGCRAWRRKCIVCYLQIRVQHLKWKNVKISSCFINFQFIFIDVPSKDVPKQENTVSSVVKLCVYQGQSRLSLMQKRFREQGQVDALWNLYSSSIQVSNNNIQLIKILKEKLTDQMI